MKNKTLIIAAFALLASGVAHGQFNETNNLFYHSFRTPQSNRLNPAFFPNKNTFYMNILSLDVQFGSPLAIGDIIKPETQSDGSKINVVDITGMLDQLTIENRFRFGLDVDLMNIGFKVHNTFFNVGARLNTDINIGLPIDVINFLRQGNVRTVNGVDVPVEETVLAGSNIFNAQMYGEFSLGAGHHFEALNLTVGARAKLLYGIMNLNLDNTRVVVNTYGDNFDRVKLDAYYEVQAASVVPFNTEDDNLSIAMPGISDILSFKNANMGLAFDVGAKYDMGPFSFSVAILDISPGIHWKNNVGTITPQNGHDTMTLTGVNVSDVFNGGEMNTDTLVANLKEFVENLKPKFNLGGDYWYSIPTRINVGASYSFAKMFRAGFLFHGQLDKGLLPKKITTADGNVITPENTFRWNSTFSFGVNVFNWMEIIAASSIVSDGVSKFNFVDNCLNPGVGIILTPATVLQLYVMADYVSSLYVTKAKAANLKFGLNVLIGNGGGKRVSRN